MNDVSSTNQNVGGGVPCFRGTRVAVLSSFEHLRRGRSVDEFLAQFPTVRRDQTDAVLEQAADAFAHAALRVGA